MLSASSPPSQSPPPQPVSQHLYWFFILFRSLYLLFIYGTSLDGWYHLKPVECDSCSVGEQKEMTGFSY